MCSFLQGFPARGKTRPADKLQVKTARILPLVGLARSKQDPTVGMVLNIHTAPSAKNCTGNQHTGVN